MQNGNDVVIDQEQQAGTVKERMMQFMLIGFSLVVVPMDFPVVRHVPDGGRNNALEEIGKRT